MSTFLTLEDGTEFLIYACSSNRPVLVGFKLGDLEKLLKLKPQDKVKAGVNEKEVTYEHFCRVWLRGEFAAYIPNTADYLKIANHL